ncbi:MAG: tetratricopeptide repeat protein [Chloroflexi bacterium]|nr:tetratricopeptide repeat protein [Chloroflexota bacterium]MDA1271180.1 tetratricopeptide repeat protein [Chloroflexota bacterium]
MADVFIYLVLLLVSIWTARLAITKGRNAWTWGGAALLLGMLPWHLFGVLPALALLFINNPAPSSETRPDRQACPRCAKSYSNGQHFCTGCGWDLSSAYSPEEREQGEASPAQPQTTVRATAVQTPPDAVEATGPVAETEQATQESAAAVAEESPGVESHQASAEEPNQPGEAPTTQEAPEADSEPEKEYVPWGTYAPGIAPTAAVMVGRGIERFSAGKYQEAIDQFTKAIALDPNYAEAWERRAEAYSQMGRSEQADQDRRHLQGLDPSSTPG